MSLLETTLAAIRPPREAAARAVEERLAARLGDPRALGELAALLEKYVAITGQTEPRPPKKCAVICCADHGVAEMNVSAYPPSTTVQMTANYLISRGGTANALSNFAGAKLLVADLGIAADTDRIPGLLRKKIAPGTRNCAKGPAMTREEAVRAVETGIELAEACIAEGCCCFLPGEMGIANTTSSACVAAAVCGLTPEEATGRGTNISDERLKVKIEVVRQALAVNRPDPTDGLDLLMKVGGFEIGCIAGIILGAAAHHAFVVLDGFNTGSAALIARALSPLVPHYLMGSHLAAEPAHKAMLETLGIRPYMDMRFRLGEATGSSIAVNLLDAAVRVYGALGGAQNDEAAETAMPAANGKRKSADETRDFAVHALDRLKAPLPEPSRAAMDACQLRIDNLTKPIYCLGRLEEIAVRLAGVLDDERPRTGLARALLVFSENAPGGAQRRLTAAFAAHAGAGVVCARLRPGASPDEAFDFGYRTAAAITASTKLLGLALTEASESDAFGTKAAAFRRALSQADGTLPENPSDALARLPAPLARDAAALFGAMRAAAENRALVILDDPSTELAARCAETLCPGLRPYLLHIQPALLHLGMTSPGGCAACLGLKLVDAALHMMTDMKTFAEANVPVANDGPGAGRQVE